MQEFFKNLKKKSSMIFKKISKPHPHKRIDNLNKSVHQSFTNLRNDMEHVSKLLHHFDNKHKEHDNNFKSLIKRLEDIESIIKESKVPVSAEEEKENLELSKEEQPIEDPLWESLTETQQKLCWKLAALQKEMPNQWISLKYLAQELYPDKEYSTVRSTLSQFITALEEMGIVKRKRKGKQAYVYSTTKNPCNTKKRPVAITSVEKKKEKKKQK